MKVHFKNSDTPQGRKRALKKFRKSYEVAKHNGEEKFSFEFEEGPQILLTDYAKYLLEYLEGEYGSEGRILQ